MYFGRRRDDVIHHEPPTQTSYCWCHCRAAGVALNLSLCLCDKRQACRRKIARAAVQESREEPKTAESGSVCLETRGSSSLSDSYTAEGVGEPDECQILRSEMHHSYRKNLYPAHHFFLHSSNVSTRRPVSTTTITCK